MKTMKLLTLITLLFAGFHGTAQTQFWSDNFEDAGSPSTGSRTPSVAEFYCTTSAYFTRTTGSVPSISPVYTGFTNSKFFAAADIDRGSACANGTISAGQTITWSSISIAGKSGLSFKGFFGAETSAVFQGLPFLPSMDSMAIEYRIDGGAWTKVIGIYCVDNTTNGGRLGLDNNHDRIGDTPVLANALTEISANITGTGNFLDLRFDVFVNNGFPGSIAVDNFRLFETASCTAPVVTSQPSTNSDVCAGGTKTITGNATGATTFKWQYDTGSGFTDVPNSAPYSGVTTTTLTITGATTAMNGYDYRMVAINGVASCFTNSSSSNLRVSAINTSANTQTNVACNGGNTGNATVIPSGGITTGYTYSWSPSGGTGATASSLTQGTYTVTVTDAALTSCTATQSFTITQPPVLNGSTIVSNVSCISGSNGAINLTPSGGAGGYTFSWSGGATTEDRTGLLAGTYSVTITDANSCVKTVSGITVTQPTAGVSGTTVVTNVSCNSGSNGAINLTPAGGSGGYTFNWLPSGPTTEDRTGLTAGTYSVIVTDMNGCTSTTISATVTQPTAPVSGTTVVTDVACHNGSNGAINLTPAGGSGGYTFNWLPSGPTTEDRTGLTAGTYSVIVTDMNGCTSATISATVTQPTTPVSGTTVVTNVSCNSGSNGAINLTPAGGSGGYTFNWLPSGPTTEDRTGLTAGTYSVIVTDMNGCTSTTISATVTQPTDPVSGTTVVTNVSCNSGTNGAINLTPAGGSGGYTFNWLPSGPTTEDRTGLTAGTYSVIVTDMNGCTSTTISATVTQPTAPVSGTTVVTNVACNSGSNGAINLTPAGGSGGYTFNWLPSGPTTEDRTGLAAGTYSVIVTDMNGCTSTTISATVTQPTAPVSGTTVVTDVTCNGGTNGAINLTPAGGSGGYTFNWLPSGPTTEDRTGLTAGTYSVIVTDMNGCTSTTISATLTQPTTPVSGTTVVTDVTCNGGTNGAINLTPAGGSGGYTFNWLPSGPTTEDRTGLTAGTYSVIVTDMNGCTSTTISATVTQPTSVSGTAAVTDLTCNNGTNGAIDLTPSGGTSGYTYNWEDGTTTQDRTGLTAGTYSVIVTDANGCTGTVNATVTQPTAIDLSNVSNTDASCFNGGNGTASVTPTGGTGTYTYSWSPSGGTGATASGLSAGTYTVTVTDANTCEATQTVVVGQPAAALDASAGTQTDVSCNNGTNGSATVSPTGGTTSYSYSWAPTGGTGATAAGLMAGTYTVTVTDAHFCQDTKVFTITEPLALDLSTVSQVDVLCNGGATGSATVTPTGGTGTYTYSWSPSGGTSATASGLTAGTYTVTVTDANTCQASQMFVLTESAPITSSFSHTTCGTYVWGTQSHNTSGTYTQNFTAVSGCDSLVTLNLTISPSIFNTVSVNNCGAYTWAQNGTTYPASGMYVDTIPSVGGCDSIVTLDLTINSSSSSSSSHFACGTYTWAQNGMTYVTSGVYTDTIPNAAGCDSIITLNLTIGGSTATQSVTVCDNYTWTTTGINYTTSGIYADTLIASGGCDSILVLNLTVTGSPVATATDSGNATITASSGTTYQWINCTTNAPVSGATAQTFAPSANGTYAVVITNAGNCSDTSNCVVISNVGLADLNLNTVQVFPNPTDNQVTITMTFASANLIITDVHGKTQFVGQISNGQMISLSDYEDGVYFLSIQTEAGTVLKRIVKN